MKVPEEVQKPQELTENVVNTVKQKAVVEESSDWATFSIDHSIDKKMKGKGKKKGSKPTVGVPVQAQPLT